MARGSKTKTRRRPSKAVPKAAPEAVPRPAPEAAPRPGRAATSRSVPQSKLNLEISASRQFTDWLAEQQLSLAFTTYRAGRLFLVGSKEGGRLTLFERFFNRCMGLWADSETLYLSSLYQIWRFTNALAPGAAHKGHDRLFVPRVGYTTGDLDVHDMAVDGDGRLIFVNSLHSCLATLSQDHSFTPLWRPPFISRLAAEDRCHLNGLALRDGRPAYVTAVSESDIADGWRERRGDGGCVIDVAADEVVLRELSMPHSPRWYRDRLWLHDSGTGRFGTLEPESGRFEPVATCPGYLRGLVFHGDFAIAGVSKPRDGDFKGLALDEILADRKTEPRCGLLVIDLKSGDIVHWLRLEGVIGELYDVAVLPGVVRPTALGFKTDEVRRAITIGAEETLSGRSQA